MTSRRKDSARDTGDKQYLLKIGHNIRTLRKQRGYSQEEFADVAGFSRSYYTEIETGKRNLSVLNLIKILKALNVDANAIIGSFIQNRGSSQILKAIRNY